MSVPALSAHGLGCVLGSRAVLEDVSLALAPGELRAVLGPNGAGKTTLVRLLSGVMEAGSGHVELLGRRLALWPRRELARALAVVPQELAVPFPYTVREIVAMGRAPHLGPLGREGPSDRAAVAAALEALGLAELAERLFPTLSGGERQRVTLARALAQGARVLLLDEPTAHMDLGHRLHAFQWLRGWVGADPDRAALVVTHDLALAARFADRITLLERGRTVAEGEPAQVLDAATIARVYRVDARVRLDDEGRPEVFARGSRIVYTRARNEHHHGRSGERDP